MKQLQKGGQERKLLPPVISSDSTEDYTTGRLLIKETETVIRERTYIALAPICSACGEAQTRIVGRLFECLNESCPSHDPDPATAIPLREEGKKLIDVKPIRRAA